MTDATDKAMIVAQYTDYRPLRGPQKVVRIICEIPINLESELHARLGYPGEEGRPVVISLIDPETVMAYGAPPKEAPAREKRKLGPLETLKPSQQAGILCADPEFWEYLSYRWNTNILDEADAATVLRARLRMDSRSVLNTCPVALNMWERILEGFRQWQTERRNADALKKQREIAP